MPKPKILVIDDDAGIRESLKMTLEYDGYDVIGAATGPEGLNLVERDAPDLVLLDVKMPGMDGFDVMTRLHSMQSGLPSVMISAHGTGTTGADAIKKGAVDFSDTPRSTDRGTIFLDEVGDMSPKTQAKVLRVLQEGEVERIGSARTIKVDVRVIAATNKNLEEEIEKGNFREDLYFRLAVIPIYVPPLRERPEDIAMIVRHFMETVSRASNMQPNRLSPADRAVA